MTVKSSEGNSHEGAGEDPGSGVIRRRRAYVWVGSVGTALVIAIATTIGTGIGLDLLSVITRHASGPPSGGPPATPSSGPPAKPFGGPPVKIDAVTLGRNAAQGGTYVFPQRRGLSALQLQALNQLNPSQPEYDTWFRSKGGVDPDWSSIKLVIEGNRTHPVQLIGIRAIKRCRKPLNGTLFYSPPAGAQYTIGIGFNLDSVTSIAQNAKGYLFSGDYFATHTISLAHGEVQTLQILAHTTKQYCEYTLELTVVDGESQATETITNHGQPFRVTATNVPFSYYKALYVGGVAAGATNFNFVSKNPATYRG